MKNIVIVGFCFIKSYFFIDFIFVCGVVLFPINIQYFLHWALSNSLTRIVEIPFVEKFPLASFAYILFCITWLFRMRRLYKEGIVENVALNHRQIGGRIFIAITVSAIYIKNYVLNDAASQVITTGNRSSIFIELLYCWVLALMSIEFCGWVVRKLLKLK